jgi:hypothetical protein
MKKTLFALFSLGNSVSKCSIKSPTDFYLINGKNGEYHQGLFQSAFDGVAK